MATTLLTYTAADAEFLWTEMKQVWLHNRQFNEFPTCTLRQRNTSASDYITGIETSTWDAVTGKTDILCDFEDISTEEIAAAAGLLSEGDKRFVAYDVGSLEDFSPYRIEIGSTYYKIQSESYETISGRSDLVLQEAQESS